MCTCHKHLQSEYFDNINGEVGIKIIIIHKNHIIINAESSRHVVTIKLRIACCKDKETNCLPRHQFLLPELPLTGSHVGCLQQRALLGKTRSMSVSPPGAPSVCSHRLGKTVTSYWRFSKHSSDNGSHPPPPGVHAKHCSSSVKCLCLQDCGLLFIQC